MIVLTTRPVIFDYESVPKFVGDMLGWRRSTQSDFSIRTSLENSHNCSPTLVTQVTKGARSLTRDRVPVFGKLLGLTNQETKYLDQWVAINRLSPKKDERSETKPVKIKLKAEVNAALKKPLRIPQDKIMNEWLHAYVKESAKLKGFSPDPTTIHRLLGGIASIPQIKKSLDFLTKEGFLRRTIDDALVPNELVSITTDETPDMKIRAFHLKALDIVKRGFDLYPWTQRRAETYVLAVNEQNLHKIKKIMTDCMDQIEQFEHEHPNENERVYQVCIHLTPVGGRMNELH